VPDVVTVTLNPALDESGRVRRVVPEDKLRLEEVRIDPGGGGINVARNVHALGGEVLAFWSRGGPYGDRLAELLDGARLPHRSVRIAADTRHSLTVDEATSDHQYRFVLPGPRLTDDEQERWIQVIEGLDARILVLSGSLPPGVDPGFMGRLVRAAPRDCKVIVDAPGEGMRRALEAGVHLIKPNLRELEAIHGGSLEASEDIVRAARDLIHAGATRGVVVSLGAEGALCVTPDSHRPIPAPGVTEKSRVGAGDAAVAGLALATARGDDLHGAARLAVAAGSASVMQGGTSPARREDVERLLRTME